MNLLQPAPPKKPDTDDSDEGEDAKVMSSTVKELPCKKTGQPSHIGEVHKYSNMLRTQGNVGYLLTPQL